MAFRLGDDTIFKNDIEEMSEINLIPLIDVMLVLMIIFLVTSTVLNPSVPLDLPNTSAQVQPLPSKVISLSIDKQSGLYWNDIPITMTDLKVRLAEEATFNEDPTLQIRADKDARYETIAQIMALAGEEEITKIAFVSK